jgi:hypothetical protein
MSQADTNIKIRPAGSDGLSFDLNAPKRLFDPIPSQCPFESGSRFAAVLAKSATSGGGGAVCEGSTKPNQSTILPRSQQSYPIRSELIVRQRTQNNTVNYL